VKPLLAFGVTLARRGPLAVTAIAISILTTIACAAVAAAYAVRTSPDAPVHDVPIVASSALAWGGGFLLAVGASAGALRRDGVDGIRHLLLTRTTSMRGYVVARVGGLAALLGGLVGGGTLVTGLVAVIAASRVHALPRTIQGTFASIVFSVAFALVIAPLALAALGSRGRAWGYFFLLMTVFVPELVANALTGPLPSELTELFAVPSALAALRSSLAPGAFDLFRAVRASLALGIFALVATLIVRRDANAPVEDA
jgi:hypothetical protein